MAFIPIDGRITSLNPFAGALVGTELQEVVSPGSVSQSISYKVTTAQQAAFYATYPYFNIVIITAGATLAVPYAVSPTNGTILFNKTIGSPSYAVMPLVSAMPYPVAILFKDLKGDAASNPITISFSGGQLCDGQSTVVIADNYGWARINPVPGGTVWFES